MQTATLVVFCKRPKLGQGKQRLAQEIGQHNALKVAQCLLDCAMADARQWQQELNGQVVISPASSDDIGWAGSLLENATVLAQPRGNLGRRLNYIDRQLCLDAQVKKVFIGTDAPCLGINELLTVERQLNHSDVVLQPAKDGGVTIMATRKPWPGLHALPWSTSELQQALCAQCLHVGQSVQLLSTNNDVDYWDDLLAVQKQLQQDGRHTRQVLASCIAELSA